MLVYGERVSPAPSPVCLTVKSLFGKRLQIERNLSSIVFYLDANEEVGIPVIVFDAEIDAILCLRSGNVSMTKSRNSNNAPTSFCNS